VGHILRGLIQYKCFTSEIIIKNYGVVGGDVINDLIATIYHVIGNVADDIC
jgi:hypothetical protein